MMLLKDNMMTGKASKSFVTRIYGHPNGSLSLCKITSKKFLSEHTSSTGKCIFHHACKGQMFSIHSVDCFVIR